MLTWHTHGGYLYCLTQAPHDFYVLSKPERPPGYAGKSGHMPWGGNLHAMPVDAASRHQFDCILFQDDPQYQEDQYRYLSESQRKMATVIENGVPGYVATGLAKLILRMQQLLADPEHVRLLGCGAQRYAMERFHIDRFVSD